MLDMILKRFNELVDRDEEMIRMQNIETKLRKYQEGVRYWKPSRKI